MVESGMIAAELSEKIRARTANTCVVGLGYVGLPLAVELGRAGYRVTGIDRDPEKIQTICSGGCYIADVEPDVLAKLVDSGMLRATTDPSVLETVDAVSISVPTPLRKTRDPDLSYVVAAAEDLAAHIHPGMLVILESTTYPGTTEEAILPVIEKSGLKVGVIFSSAFLPNASIPATKTSTRAIFPR